MNKKGNGSSLFRHLKKVIKAVKQSYLYRLVSKFLSSVCSVILVILLIVGAFMFYFNLKAKSYQKQGKEYTAPFGLYTIISGSMEPNVSVYDVVIAVDQDISKIKVGDIITFISSWDINYGITVTHRVVGISKNEAGEYQLLTKGDNNGTADGGTVTQSNLIGKVVGRLPQLGRLQFFLATKMGWFVVVFIPAMIIIILDMIKIFKLYVLKEQINNVKTSKEATKEKTVQRLKEKDVPLATLNRQALKTRNRNDETVDTVELPKIGIDGIIKESTTSELPMIKTSNQIRGTEDIDIPAFKKDIDIELPKFENTNVNKDVDIDIPLLNKSVDNTVQTENIEVQKKLLKRRN